MKPVTKPDCPECNGSGVIEWMERGSPKVHSAPCPKCRKPDPED